MQMFGLFWSLMRTSLYCVFISIRQDYRDRGTLAFGKCHCDSTWFWNARLSLGALSLGFLLRVWTNKPRNYNCLPAESLIGGKNDISGLLIFLARRLASAYWGTCHSHVWWGEFNLSVRNDNGDNFMLGMIFVKVSFISFFFLSFHWLIIVELKCPVKIPGFLSMS